MSFDELKAILLSMGIDEEDIKPEATREEAGLDSLAVAELVLVLRREHGVTVTEEALHDAATVAEVADLLAGLDTGPGEGLAIGRRAVTS